MKYLNEIELIKLANKVDPDDNSTVVFACEDNQERNYIWQGFGYEFVNRPLPVSLTTERLALQFFFTLNQN
jgi:hypothetical protein